MLGKKSSFLEVVKYIYVYFFSAVGTIMIIVGVYRFGEYAFKAFVLPEYRLEQYREAECDYIGSTAGPYGAPIDSQNRIQDDSSKQKQACKENLEEERVYQEKRDLFDSVMITFLGLIVFGIHFVWMRTKFLKHE